MDEDFFDQGQTIALSNQGPPISSDSFIQTKQQPQDDQFQFQQPIQSFQQTNLSYNVSSEQNQILKRIRQEQQKIQQKLRQKANLEYEQKIKRKEKGRLQLQEFLNKKQRQKQLRKQQNIQKQAKLRQDLKQICLESGWKKVAANINLKQGEHSGKKDVTRMRDSIINKRNDELN